MARRRALFIVNQNSRQGGLRLEAATTVLQDAGFELIALECDSPTEISPLIVERAGELDCVIAAGGDGTMNALAAGLRDSGLPLGVLPMGTANDLARTLGIPADPRIAAEIILGGRERHIDIGEVNGHPFFNVASIGLSADLAQALTPGRKRRFGRFAYALTALHVLFAARPFRAVIAMRSGISRVKTLQIAVGNGRYYGGGMAVEASARIDDGTLDLYSLEVDGVWKLALMLRSFRNGSHGLWSEVRTERCVAFEVRTRRPRPVNTDGELATFTPARFTIRPGAIRVFAP